MAGEESACLEASGVEDISVIYAFSVKLHASKFGYLSAFFLPRCDDSSHLDFHAGMRLDRRYV